MNNVWFWSVIVFVLVATGFVVFGLTVKLPYTEMVTYTERVPINKVEKYEDSEPYTAEQCEEQRVKYNVDWGFVENTCLGQECANHYQVCVEKNFWGNCVEYAERCSEYRCVKTRLDCRLNIKNIDDAGGVFGLDGYVVNADNGAETFVGDVTVYVRAQDTGTAYWSYVYVYPQVYSCRWRGLEAPTKTVCDNVIRYRTVTKERTVVGQEEVQRQKEVVRRRTLFDSWGITR